MEAVIILYPFTRQTNLRLAVMLLLQHVSYHIQMGFTKVVQYTQVRHRPDGEDMVVLINSQHRL